MILFIRMLLFISVLFQSSPFSVSCVYAQRLDETRRYPLPMVEAEQILSGWFADSGFKIFQDPLEGDRVRITALKGSEKWEVILEPSSPLASFLSVRYALEGKPDRTRVESLWAFVEEYLRSPSSGKGDIQEIPASVLSRKESLVCIKARMNGSPIQFSGFLINTEGLILSTAHDLQGVQEIVVLYRDQPFQGRLVRIDLERDLSLIRITLNPSPSIPLAKARTLLKDEERVYILGCPSKQYQEGNSGMIDGPVRQVNHFPLWQVKMEILPGSSGSPAFDARGDFVGVVKGRYRGSDSIGFLIPARTVLEFLKER